MKTTNNEQKTETKRNIFDDYEVECNLCEKYWLNQCDGVKCNTKRKCTSYIAVRRDDIPQKVDKNKHEIHDLRNLVFVIGIVLSIHIVLDMIAWCTL